MRSSPPSARVAWGKCYEARDTRLDRTVAVKILPEGVSADPTQRERFQREAKAIAALNHPHPPTTSAVCGARAVERALR